MPAPGSVLVHCQGRFQLLISIMSLSYRDIYQYPQCLLIAASADDAHQGSLYVDTHIDHLCQALSQHPGYVSYHCPPMDRADMYDYLDRVAVISVIWLSLKRDAQVFRPEL